MPRPSIVRPVRPSSPPLARPRPHAIRGSWRGLGRPLLGLALTGLAVLAGTTASPAHAADTPLEVQRQAHPFASLTWRCIGPSRGGRAAAVAGVPGQPLVAYMGPTGGGVWRTTTAGARWENVSDGEFGTGCVGAITVAPSNPNVVWVGMGETDPRGNVSHGDGVYRSVDAGETWAHVGLEATRHIGRIVVHPEDPDVAWVAALGHVWGPNPERGVFHTTDGGATWSHVLDLGPETGVVDLSMDPFNADVLYAGAWAMDREPWTMTSGGGESGLYRSADGGETWTELTRGATEGMGEGLPPGLLGKVAVSASAAQRGRVWALIEAKAGGLFRSDDDGRTWTKVSGDRRLRQRAWYYTDVTADPVDPDTVYVMNVQFLKSIDGGRTFDTIRVPHADNHDLWIDPTDNQHLVNANDGGANVSFDGGRSWSRQDNQPTAQFYRVSVDDQFPYRVYGAQQDNSTVSVSSRNRLGGRDDFYPVGGGESGHIAARPGNPDIVYAGSYGGHLTRYDHATRLSRNVMVWPDNAIGHAAASLRHRFNWNFPIIISEHDPDVVYVAGERVFRSTNDGATWTAISEDLTTDDESRQQLSGGDITYDNTTVEYYCTIFALEESPLRRGLLWAGTDDGRVHVTWDGGGSWTDVTPRGLGADPMVNSLDASPHDPDRCLLAITRYKSNDFRPMIVIIDDGGRTWSRRDTGIPEDAFVRVVREDPVRPGLLYAGTELGVFVSMDDGRSWQSLQLDLPIVPITDMVVHGNDLVVATQGRSFWILEDLTVLRQWSEDVADDVLFAMDPADAVRASGFQAAVHLHVPGDLPAGARMEVVNADGDVVRRYGLSVEKAAGASGASDGDAATETAAEDASAATAGADGDADVWIHPSDRRTVRAGWNRLTWNLRHASPTPVEGLVGWPGSVPGAMVPPGAFTVRVVAGPETMEVPLELLPDPRVDTDAESYAAQYALRRRVDVLVDDTHRSVQALRRMRGELDAAVERMPAGPAREEVRAEATRIKQLLTEVEETVVQPKNESSQDPLNYPGGLSDKVAYLAWVSDGSFAPTAAATAVLDEYGARLQTQIDRYRTIVAEDVAAFNALCRDRSVPAVRTEAAPSAGGGS